MWSPFPSLSSSCHISRMLTAAVWLSWFHLSVSWKYYCDICTALPIMLCKQYQVKQHSLEFDETYGACWLFHTVSFTYMQCTWMNCVCIELKPRLFLYSLHPHGHAVTEPWSIIEALQVKHDRDDSALLIPHTTSPFLQTPRDTVTAHHRVTAAASMNPDFRSWQRERVSC